MGKEEQPVGTGNWHADCGSSVPKDLACLCQSRSYMQDAQEDGGQTRPWRCSGLLTNPRVSPKEIHLKSSLYLPSDEGTIGKLRQGYHRCVDVTTAMMCPDMA